MKCALIVAAAAVALTSGCATAPNSTLAYNDAANVDFAKVDAVDSVARTRGVMVKWINYPQKKSTAVGVAPAAIDPTGT